MEEQLKIKLVVDTSDLKSSINQTKRTLKSVNAETDGVKQGVGETNDSFEQLKGTLQGIMGLNAMDTIMNAITANKGAVDRVVQSFKNLKTEIFGIGGSADMFKESFRSLFTDSYWDEVYGSGEIPARNLNGMKQRFSEFVGYTKEGSNGLKGAFSSLGASITNLISSINPVVLAIGVIVAYIAAWTIEIVALYKAMKTLITTAMDTAKQLHEVAAAAGKANMSVREYESWGYILKMVGVEADKVVDFVKKITEKQNELRKGSEETAAAFEELGISQEKALSLSSSDLFNLTVERLSQVENATQKASIAQRIFTDDATQLANVIGLSNSELRSLNKAYYELGAAPSNNLIKQSSLLTAHTTNLSYAWEGIKNTVAEIFLPVIIQVVGWLTKAVAAANLLLKTLFNIDLSNTFVNQSTGNVADGYTNSFNEATQAAEEFKRVTLGFDELNVMPSTKTSAAGSDDSYSSIYGSGGGSGFKLPEIETPDLTKFKEWLEKYKGIIKTAIGIGLILGGIITFLLTGGLTAPLSGFAIGAGFSLATGEGSWIGEKVENIKKKIKGVKDWFTTNVAPLFTKKYWTDKWENVKTAFATKIQETHVKIKNSNLVRFFENEVKPIFTVKYWTGLWEKLKYAANEKIAEIYTTLYNSKLAKWFRNNVAPVFTQKHWTGKWENLKAAAKSSVSEIYSTIYNSKLCTWFRNTLLPKFSTSYWTNKFSTIKDGAKSAFNGLIGIVEKAINNIIAKINTLSWKVPDWVPKIGGEKFGFNFKSVSIPRLATGGIAVNSTLANIGENGREAVLPLENNTGWMDILADRIAARQPQTPTKLVLKVGERELGYATIGAINNITRQTGELQLAMI